MSRPDLDALILADLKQSPGLALGPAIFGLFLDGFLLAVTLVLVMLWQVRLAATDSRTTKALVYYLTTCCVAHSALCLATCMDSYVTHNGDYMIWITGWWWKGQYMFELLLCFPVEIFFINRAYQIWEKSTAMLILLVVPLLGWSALLISVLAVYPVNWRYSDGALVWAFIALLMVGSWLVSGAIMWGLHRKRGGFPQSRLLVKRIIMLSAEAQLVPSGVALGFVICTVLTTKNNFMWAFMSAPKLSAITCLVVIYSRLSLRRDVERHRTMRQNTFDHELFPSDVADSAPGKGAILLVTGQTTSKGLYSLDEEQSPQVLTVELSRMRTAQDTISSKWGISPAADREGSTAGEDGKRVVAGDPRNNNVSEVSFGEMFR